MKPVGCITYRLYMMGAEVKRGVATGEWEDAASALNGALRELSLQRATVHAQRARRRRDVALVLGEHALDVLPFEPPWRHRLERRERIRSRLLARAALENSDDGARRDGRRDARVAGQHDDAHLGMRAA